MPSFDVVSKIDLAELDNAVNQAKKEISQRYDFRGTNSNIDRTDAGLTLTTSDKEHLEAMYRVLLERIIKRGVSPKVLDAQDPEPAAKQSLRQTVLLRQGIPADKAKELNKLIKDSKLKVQSQYQDEQLRVTGKNKDDLQAAIRLLRSHDIDVPLQFVNFRD